MSTDTNLTTQELEPWLQRIRSANQIFREKLGRARFVGLQAVSHLLAAPRLLRKFARREIVSRPMLQLPWMPLWPGLASRPLHRADDHPWTTIVRDAYPAIKSELLAVQRNFARARFDSDLNPLPWNTYYFYLQGKAVPEHLAECPATAAVLRLIPHNGFHVCFSAIAPLGSLHPHTGPTNTSLTAHLGLSGCEGSMLSVADCKVDYRDGDLLVFDDSFVHWVGNTSGNTRYTLMITFWHPELNGWERRVLGHLVRGAEV